MSWKRYKLWVINTASESSIYTWENWKLILPSLDKIIQLSDAEGFIRTFQSFTGENKWLGFGRMNWSEENNRKWTSKYREKNHSKTLEFFGTEIWAPDWNQVCREGIPPDIFIQLYNFPNDNLIREGVVIAVSKRLVRKDQLLIDESLNEIRQIIPNSTMSVVSRFWGPGWTFPNQIQDINNVEIEKIVRDNSNVSITQ